MKSEGTLGVVMRGITEVKKGDAEVYFSVSRV